MSGMANAGTAHAAGLVEWHQIGRSFERPTPADDPVVHHLGVCLHTARSRPSEMSPACADHIASALQAYLRWTHNVVTLPAPVARGGLAPWQLRRAKEIMGSHLDEAVPLVDIARACNLSLGHFARAFRQTTGQPPHRWLIEQRITKAKRLLAENAMPLADIAIACGFADQSHFTRVFMRATQSSPGAWRRYHQAEPPSTEGVACRLA